MHLNAIKLSYLWLLISTFADILSFWFFFFFFFYDELRNQNGCKGVLYKTPNFWSKMRYNSFLFLFLIFFLILTCCLFSLIWIQTSTRHSHSIKKNDMINQLVCFWNFVSINSDSHNYINHWINNQFWAY